MSRDAQKARVYAAEQQFNRLLDLSASHDIKTIQIAGSTIVLPTDVKFGTVENVQTYVNKVLALSVVREAHPRATKPVSVRERRGQASAHYEWGTIAVPPHRGSQHSWAMREMVVLHELAHHLTVGDGHGAQFTEAYLFLVDIALGPEASFILRHLLSGAGAS